MSDESIRRRVNEGVAELTVGAGMELPVAKHFVFIQLNLVHGLSLLEPSRFKIEGSAPDMRTRTWCLEAGLWL